MINTYILQACLLSIRTFSGRTKFDLRAIIWKEGCGNAERLAVYLELELSEMGEETA
jgi:hypothetical protein